MILRALAMVVAMWGCCAALVPVSAAQTGQVAVIDPATLQQVNAIIEQWRSEAHVPGLVYGIVSGGQLVAVKGQGVQDTETQRPVTPESLFRIASMSKAFTALAILKLRDEGKLSLDAAAETYLPEMRGWTYPGKDSRPIRVRDLLHHTAGLVTDDPWGDRQQPLSEADFTAMLQAGVPFSRQPGMAMEYSNFGYATLGRIITNVSGQRYQDYIAKSLMQPLGMDSTGHDIARSPLERRAIGYRWQDGAWLREPDLADGAFGAMGGIQTSARDYARWLTFLLAAWPPRDDADTGPVRRSTVREIVEGANFTQIAMRPAAVGGAPCRTPRSYAMGWIVVDDCDLGRILTHGGGYPGYGSNVMLLPDRGFGIFILTNRTYSRPAVPNWKSLLALQAAGEIPDRTPAVSAGVAQAYAIVRAIWAAGDVMAQADGLAMNFLLDRDADHWRQDLARLRAETGSCAASEPVVPVTAMQGRFAWTCERGTVQGGFLLAPTGAVNLQALQISAVQP